MIKTRKGNVRCKGSAGELLADLGVIVTALYNDVLLPKMAADEAKHLILDTVEMVMLPDDEMVKRLKVGLLNAISELVCDLNAECAEKDKGEYDNGSK